MKWYQKTLGSAKACVIDNISLKIFKENTV